LKNIYSNLIDSNTYSYFFLIFDYSDLYMRPYPIFMCFSNSCNLNQVTVDTTTTHGAVESVGPSDTVAAWYPGQGGRQAGGAGIV
jgi:hypothetical protein